MAKIILTKGFSLIPEGTHIFKITEVIYKEDFGKLEVKMETATGQTHTERFNLIKSDGSINEGAINAFSYFAKTAMNDYTLSDIDHQDLIGHFLECTVEHDVLPSNKDPNKTVTFVRLADKSPSDGFDEEVAPPKKTETSSKKATKAQGGIDLDALLG